ncbi:hypothetical protein MLD38_029837 [Melastoma candidum]|uniref:Uncharacterized protein n=1 Tax=Melastoma candidum TaxID=119954 RepID=A0ACB9N7A4_9MYRT|nr:hypothetical protein MLD38_029837 [Melastoma candidum]
MAAAEEVSDHDHLAQKKKPLSEDDKRRKKMVPGGLMKATIRPGGGESTPKDGDQVVYHCAVRTLDGVVVQSSKSEFGGKGIPIRQVLGKSKILLGLLEGMPTMSKGEVAMFKIKSPLHYGEEDCPVPVPSNFPKDDDLHFEIEMIDFFKPKQVVTDDLGVVKKTPREPYEIKARISGKKCDGKSISSCERTEPYLFTFGKSEASSPFKWYLSESPLLPLVGDFEEIHFEVELVHFVQVRDMLRDGRLIKCRICDGQGDFPMDCPLHDSRLRVHYKGMLLDNENSVFYDTRIDNDGQPLEFCSGEGLVIPEGFEMCVRLMLPGEIANLQSNHVFGK